MLSICDFITNEIIDDPYFSFESEYKCPHTNEIGESIVDTIGISWTTTYINFGKLDNSDVDVDIKNIFKKLYQICSLECMYEKFDEIEIEQLKTYIKNQEITDFDFLTPAKNKFEQWIKDIVDEKNIEQSKELEKESKEEPEKEPKEEPEEPKEEPEKESEEPKEESKEEPEKEFDNDYVKVEKVSKNKRFWFF